MPFLARFVFKEIVKDFQKFNCSYFLKVIDMMNYESFEHLKLALIV